MPTPVEMTPGEAMKAVMSLRDALADIEAGRLKEGALLPLVKSLVWPQVPDADEMAWAVEQAWDDQIERDAKAGKLDWLLDEARADHAAGRITKLPE